MAKCEKRRAGVSPWQAAILYALLLAFAPVVAAEESILALAAKRATRAEAESRLFTLPSAERRPLVDQLLKNGDPDCRLAAISVIDQTFDVAMLPHLQAALRKESNAPVRGRLEREIERLRIYEPIAVDYDPGREERSQPKRKLFHPIAARVAVKDVDGRAVAGAEVRAYADDYGLCVPLTKWERTDNSGECRLDLFPGKWTFFATAKASGGGLYVCIGGVTVSADDTIALQAKKRVPVEFRDGEKRLAIDEVKVIDSAFANFFPPSELGNAANGDYVLQVRADRTFDLTAVRKPKGGQGAVLHAKGVAASRLALGTSQTSLLRFTSAGATHGQAAITFSCFDKPEAVVDGDLPFDVRVTPGPVELAYSYSTPNGHHLDFRRQGCTLTAGQERAIALGGPYQCSIFHQFFKQHGQGPDRANILAYYLFVRDPNGCFLVDCREGRKMSTIPLEIVHKSKTLFSTERGKTNQQLMSEAGSIDPKTDLSSLRYRIKLPFAKDSPFEVAGHGSDFSKEGEHFRFEGPAELTGYADDWLRGAEAVYNAFAKVLGTQTRSRESGKKQTVRIHVKMPPGIGAFAGGGNVTFPVGAGLAISRPERILTVPLLHEVLHTFGHGHQDYMRITCQEAGVVLMRGRPAAREAGLGTQEELYRCLRGEQARVPENVVPDLLRGRFGYSLFLRYVAAGKSKRETLRAQGLSEVEADCAIFDSLTKREARNVYLAAGVKIDADKVNKGVALVQGGGSVAAAPDTSQSKNAANRAVQDVRKALEKHDRKQAGKKLEEAKSLIPQVGDYRFQADKYLTLGQLYFMEGKKDTAYEMLQECQRAAAHVSASYVGSARGQCMNVLEGKATRTLQ